MTNNHIVASNIEKIASLFPGCVTECADNHGNKARLAIDFEKLKAELGADIADSSAERYQFTWPDKRAAIRLANTPTTMTLRPCREESVDFDNTKNIYIEGDNLHVLKVLRETYLGKVKMIYIDPPYNTGKDFIYNDNFAQGKSEFEQMSGLFDEDGNQTVAQMQRNSESNGRFHTDWLNMIYPRLKIARDLLTEDGVICISIDDKEVRNLRYICDEVFGTSNFIAQLIWQNKKGGGNDSKHVAVEHEYILVYARNVALLGKFYESYSDAYIKRYKEEDEIGRYFWDTFKRKSGKQYYPIICPDGTVLEYDENGNAISWLRSKDRFDSDIAAGEIRIIKLGEKWSVQFKQRIPTGKKPRSIFTTETVISEQGTTSSGAEDVYEYFKKDVFSNPKPVTLIRFLLGFCLSDEGIVLDFFSGSATTAEALMKENIDGRNAKYILVQLQEDIDPMLNSSDANAKIVAQNAVAVLEKLKRPHTITELAKERIRRAGKALKKEAELAEQSLDIGFRVLKLDSSNMADVYYTPQESGKQTLFDENVKPDRGNEDLLFQVMLDLGIELSAKIESRQIVGKTVHLVDGNYLVACFDSEVNESAIKEIAKLHPVYFVMRDASVADDNVIDNFEQIFKHYSPDTTCRII